MDRFMQRLLIPLAAATAVAAVACAAAIFVEPKVGLAAAVLVTGLIAGAILAFLHVLGTTTQWAWPLRKVITQSGRIAQNNWNGQAATNGAPEVRDLAEQINHLAEDVRWRLSQLQDERAGLHAVLDTLPDPILASDAQGRLILMNAPAAKLVRVPAAQALGQRAVTAISDTPIVELLEQAIQPNEPSPIHRQIRLLRAGQRLTFEAEATCSAGGGGALLVLRDVTTLSAAMQMKTDFVANASHELRTPITAINIAFETLREALGDDPAQSEKCLTVIDGHLHRLQELLRDLLDLSSVEQPEQQLAVGSVRAAEVLDDVQATMTPFARQKSVELQFDEPTFDEFFTDARLFNLILKNLVENSIKYTLGGGAVRVTLTPRTADDQPLPEMVLTVTDTGIGIAPEHIDRVFERFYQVDSSRAGSAGRGTGLGLAIVKHAVAALGGSVKLSSVVSEGTTVTCILPQRPPPSASNLETAVAGESARTA
jgi:two-component system, OmpR family, phosphate regulon sensor histidine kinase PhoR